VNVVFDYILAGIIFGILSLTVARIQVNINASLSGNTFTLMTQRNGVELARQIEHDITKIGYRVKSPAMIIADSTTIQFKAGYMNGAVVDTPIIKYYIGTTSQSTNTANPRDYPLYRQQNASPSVRQDWGLTQFKMMYYDSLHNIIATPVSAGNLKNIRSIFVKFTVESPSPVISDVDTTISSINWQKLIYPRNLQRVIR
jgi:hypothetical protein